MATIPAASAPPKRLSFAKVVASHPKESIHPVPIPRVAVPAIDRRAQTSATAITPAVMPTSVTAPAQAPSVSVEGASGSVVHSDQAPGKNGAKNINGPFANIGTTSTPSLVVNGSSPLVVESQAKNDNGASLSDDVSQRADSNSEMGAKAPSLDGKSITSGTTFALDEKESLRPDDSASVKAAAEDDEAFSVRSSLLATSRMGSENARIHRLRLGDMPEKRPIPVLSEAQDPGLATPQSGTSSQQPPPPEQPQVLGGGVPPSGDAFNSIYGKNPDEKLLEAMRSPKDRLFLLRLEQDVINFVLSSKEPYMDLPPNNSFCRMLTHKLADYYHMTHSFEAVQGSVRIFRTPFCRVPASLASIIETNADENPKTPPPAVLPKKIMRRGEDGGSGQVSTSASKATSEVGSDGKDKTALAKEKMTREEREEAYKIARERIFGNSSEKPAESGPDNDEANGVSRASSVSAKDKSSLGKRGKTGKQRRDDSESFDSRSQYIKYFAPQPQMEWSPHFIPAGMQYNGQPLQPYQYQISYQTPPPGYPTMIPNNGYAQYSNVTAYPPQAQTLPSRYPSSNGSMGGGFGPPAQPAPQPPWQPSFNQAPPPTSYQGRGPQTQPQGNTGPLGIPYAYGQLPAHANPHDPKSQHPIPGSYNRHAFNPKTQSFVPGNGMSPVQPPIGPYNMTAPPHGSPQVGSPHLGYAGYASPAPPQPYMGGPGYGMSRQSSNNSLPAYHTPQHIPQHPPAHLPQMPNKTGLPPQGPSAGLGQTFSHLPNYGNPATLPQKPPTSI
ncbi:putative R3H domain-containing protein [Rosellinia necatrix]|uniref:Putative R3H domain-containing protein n=1 Tax=Rosellinia necatrix TaxID=77044 RepID=A0A1S7UIS7_ROSNE|nr:putative R3H domain-containing protein [Rosellinia necatrix]